MSMSLSCARKQSLRVIAVRLHGAHWVHEMEFWYQSIIFARNNVSDQQIVIIYSQAVTIPIGMI